jgi:uncharacterized membrane protein
MRARARLLGHPVHQMLIVFPLGLLGGSIIFDIVYLVTRAGHWAEMAFWMVAAGIVSGLVAAVFGAIDWSAIPGGTRAKSIGLLHGLGNVVVVGLFAASWLLRQSAPQSPGTLAIALSFVGVGLALVTGWLGGELVNRLGIGVDEGAHADAPSSLTSASAVAAGAGPTGAGPGRV